MLSLKGTIKLFILNLRFLGLLGTNLFYIDIVSCKLKFHPQSFKKKTLFRCTAATLIIIATIVQLKVFKGIFPSVQLYQGIWYVVSLSSFLGTFCVSFFRNHQILILFNSLVEFERQLIQGKLFSKKMYIFQIYLKLVLFCLDRFLESYAANRSQILMLKGCLICATLSSVYAPCLAFQYWLQPCVSFASGFWILEECSQYTGYFWLSAPLLNGTVAIIFWTCFCIVLAWSFRQIIENHFFVIYHITTLVAFCLRNYINNLSLNIKSGNPTFSTPYNILVYRKLQLLVRLFNELHQDMIIIIFVLMM